MAFKVPTSYLVIELAVIILIPAILGIVLNYFSIGVRKNEEAWSGLASAAVDTMKLNATIAIPSAFYAVVQMVSLPIMVKIINSFHCLNFHDTP